MLKLLTMASSIGYAKEDATTNDTNTADVVLDFTTMASPIGYTKEDATTKDFNIWNQVLKSLKKNGSF